MLSLLITPLSYQIFILSTPFPIKTIIMSGLDGSGAVHTVVPWEAFGGHAPSGGSEMYWFDQFFFPCIQTLAGAMVLVKALTTFFVMPSSLGIGPGYYEPCSERVRICQLKK